MNTMKAGKIVYPLVFIITLAAFLLYENKDKNIPDHYIKTEAKITNVFMSGRGMKSSTLINIKYQHNKTMSGTLRRNGYREEQYNKGDSIVIYIDPESGSDTR